MGMSTEVLRRYHNTLTELEELSRSMESEEREYAAYETVKAVCSGDKALVLSPYYGTVPSSMANRQAGPAATAGSPSGFGNYPVPTAPASTAKVGHSCRTCGYFNPDAEANQGDGTYLCYNCRS